jgi:hypothetical protein
VDDSVRHPASSAAADKIKIMLFTYVHLKTVLGTAGIPYCLDDIPLPYVAERVKDKKINRVIIAIEFFGLFL